MSNTANVLAGKPLATGGVSIGAVGATGPTDATTPLDAAFKGAGYVGEDGLVEATDRSTEKVKAWGGDTVKIVQTDFAVTYAFTFLETLNADVLKTVYGDANVTTTPASATKGTLYSVKVNSAELPAKAFVFDMKDGVARIRIHVPEGKITEIGEISYKDGEVIGYNVTVEALPNAALGANAIKYLDDGKPTA